MRRFGVADRRARLAARHLLGLRWLDRTSGFEGAETVAGVAEALVGIHATDPATIFLSVRPRLAGSTPATVAAALYDDRTVLRMLGMRRTMFVVPVALRATVQHACTDAIAVRERQRTIQLVEQSGLASSGEQWLADVEPAVLAALEAVGEASAAEISDEVPAMKAQVPYGEGKKWAGQIGLGSRVLLHLAAEGHLVRGRPGGSWTSTKYQWALASAWLGGRSAVDARDEVAADPQARAESARVELARRWLASFGPATVDDLKWWTGWTLGQTRATLRELAPVEVEVEVQAGLDAAPATVAGIALAADVDDELPGSGGSNAPSGSPPWVAFLPALDATVMGWKRRGWYLGDHGPALFDRSGNAGPTIWCDGRVVGGWAQRSDGEVVYRLLDDLGAELADQVEAEAEVVRAWIDPIRVIPRFRTPLEQALTA